MAINRLNVPFEIKKIDPESGVFEGYGSIFGNIDSYSDIVAPGAFKGVADPKTVKLLWQHNSSEPIGVYEAISEDNIGLKVQGRLLLDVQRGKEAYALLKAGALSGLSIGYQTLDFEFDAKTGVRTLKELKLYEISLVTFPANELAHVTGVKSLTELKIDTLFDQKRQIEAALRDAGASESVAKFVTSHLPRPASRDAEGLAALHALIKRNITILGA